MKRVLITGINGLIGGVLRDRLGDRYEITGISRHPVGYPTHVADISDLEAIQPAFEGIDAVVHLAASASMETPWDEILPNNIVGTYNVYEAARRAGVERVVFASSNHAVGMFEVTGTPEIYALDDGRTIDHTAEIRPDSYYGVSKAYGEAMGRYYAENHGLKVFCLRIGTVRVDDNPRSEEAGASSGWLPLTREQVYDRLRATWLSHRDCAQLVSRCLDAEGIAFGVYYGISDNPRKLWDIEHARREIGYEPRDSAPV